MGLFDDINNNNKQNASSTLGLAFGGSYGETVNSKLSTAEITADAIRTQEDPVINLAQKDAREGWSVDSKIANSYSKFGLNYNPWENLDKRRAELQSNWDKFGNAVAQTIVSEIGLGTVTAVTDLYDAIAQHIFGVGDGDYQSEATKYLEGLQDTFRNEVAPIYTDPETNITNGGLLDAGWWASNIPSIASSLTLMLPGWGAMTALKAAKVGKAIGFTRKALSGANKLNKLRKAEKAGKILTEGEKLALKEPMSGFANFANKATTINTANVIGESAIQGLLSRTMENYQEARQVYNDMYDQISDRFAYMNKDDYQQILNDNAELLDNNPDVDKTDRDAVARLISKESADRTYKMDFSNTLFDVVQIYSLKNVSKLGKNIATTTPIRKELRLAKRYGTMSDVEVATKEAARSFSQKVKDFASDHAGAFRIWGSEASEGIEEVVNYIAQQEGMHYGNVMMNLEDDNSFNERFKSYLHSPELYESAFWGVLGGVVFQSAGSKINRVQNAIIKKSKETNDAKKLNTEKTEETNNTSWREAFETPENKRRIEQIQKAKSEAELLYERLKMIEDKDNPRNPFEQSSKNPAEKAPIVSDTERIALRQQAIDEFLSGVALRSIDVGNFDLMKDLLRNGAIRKEFEDRGIINKGESIENLIAVMDDTAKKYDDNLAKVTGMSSMYSDTPFEYFQILARDNTQIELEIDRLNKQIAAYEASAENNQRLFGSNLDEAIDYKGASKLVVASQRLGFLRASKKRILNDEQLAASIDGQVQIKAIDEEIKTINNMVMSDTYISSEGSSLNDKRARLMWVTGVSQRWAMDSNGNLSSIDTDEYLDFLNALSTKDKKTINKTMSNLSGTNFELTDEAIVKLFGNNEEDSGSYFVLGSDINTAFDVKKGLESKASALNDDYTNIAALELLRLKKQNALYDTTGKIDIGINRLHNTMNAARNKAINKSIDTISEIAKKYDINKLQDYIFSNRTYDELSNADKAKLDDALIVLNLTSSSNDILRQNIEMMFSLGVISKRQVQSEQEESNSDTSTADEQNKDTVIADDVTSDKNKKENSTIIQNSNTDTKEQSETSTSKQETNLITQNKTDQQQITNQSSQKVIPTISIDGDIKLIPVSENDGFTQTVDANGNVIINLEKNSNPNQSVYRKTALFDGFNPANTSKPVLVAPLILHKDDKGNYQIVQKGQFGYEETAVPHNPSTGDVDKQVDRNKTKSNNDNINSDTTIKDETLVINQEGSSTKDTAVTDNENVVLAKQDIQLERDLEKQFIIQREAIALFSQRDKSKDKTDIENSINEVKDKLQEKYKDDPNRDAIYGYIERAVNIIRARAERKGLVSSAANVLSSSITEMPNGKYNFSEEYKTAVRKMAIEFAKSCGAREINGKYYINLESLLRQVNRGFNDNGISDLLYAGLNAYFKTEEAKKDFVLTDDNTDSAKFTSDVKKSVEERINEQLVPVSRGQRVAIDRLFENPSKEFLKAFDSIEEGDKLDFKLENGDISLIKNGVTIGTLPRPIVDSVTGSFYKYNRGWKTDVNAKDGQVVSKLKEVFLDILNETNDVHKDINDAIAELNWGKLSEKERQDKIDFIYEKLTKDLDLVSKGFISASAEEEDVVEHIANLWKFFQKASTKEDIATYINRWFNLLHDTYSTINSLDNKIKTGSNVEFTVTKITDGELIRNTSSTENTRETYDAYTQSNDAISNIDNVDIGVVNRDGHLMTTNGIFSAEHSNSLSFTGKTGKALMTIKTKSGIPQVVTAIPIIFNDTKVTGDAKKTINAIVTEINDRIDNSKYTDLRYFVKSLLCKDASVNNTPLLFGVGYKNNILSDGTEAFTIGNKNGIAINIIESNGGFTFKYKIDANSKEWKQSDDINVLKSLFSNLLSTSQFNIDFNYLLIDKQGYKPSGFVRNENNKIVIRIPSIKGNDFVKEYDSYKELMVKGGFLRVNTHQENGSNFRRKGVNQAANQVLQVSINERVTSTPVGKLSDNNTNQVSKMENAIRNTPKNNVKIITDSLVNDGIFTNEEIEEINKLHILPETIVFNENLNTLSSDGEYLGDNARFLTTSKTIEIGKRWMDMFNEEGAFANTNGAAKREAFRKLIHEQLHYKLNERGRKEYLDKIESIYNEFVDAVNKNIGDINDSNRDIIEACMFANSSKNIALEEFLVESLTNATLAKYLNSVDVDFKSDKKLSNNLWQKIMKLLSKIFDWGITKGSLYEKELYALQKGIGNITKISKVGKEKNKKTEDNIKPNDKDTTGTLRFEEEQEKQNKNKDKTEDKTENKEQDNNQDLIDNDEFANEINNKNKKDNTSAEDKKKTNENIVEEEDFTFDDFDVFKSSVTEIRSDIKQEHIEEMESIKKKAIADGTFMKATNGKPTKLNEQQWLQVRTKAFKDWFGDWENNPSEASKVVDENGEPLVVYHHTDNKDLTVFSSDFDNYFSRYNKGTKSAIFFTTNRDKIPNRKYTIPVFLNLKTPFIYSGTKESMHKQGTTYTSLVNKAETQKGAIFTGLDDNKLENQTVLVAYNSNQIKSATGNNGDFSLEYNNIYKSAITETPVRHPSVSTFVETLPIDAQSKIIKELNNAELESKCF
uniref:ADP-ribosyltransferase in polyvalent protein n=1 Tax=Geladintestivirus 2 TaxID=3233134 RepID=A0AAU8MKD2_9CAUD